MTEILYLAWRYLAFNRLKTIILIASIMLIIYLPVALNLLVRQSAEQLTARAEATPLLVGEKGSSLELVLNSLYFEARTPALTRYEETLRIRDSQLARPIPLYVRFRAGDFPIVGTGIEYFEFRRLRVTQGRMFTVLGECVLGHQAARQLGATPGSTVISSPENVFDLSGIYPLKMHVVGVLAPSYTPDDGAIFVDIKTAWIIEGRGHGHQDLTQPEATSAVLAREGDRITANASVVQYNEINEENIDSFHFHGDLSDYPVSAVVAVPNDQKMGVLLMGRYENPEERSQIVRPLSVMTELLATVFTVQAFLVAGVLIVGVATVATTALVFLLSLRLRRREIETMFKLGGARHRVGAILLSEVLIVLILATGLAALLTALTSRFGSAAIQSFILS